jgi:hypothetical protein
MGDGEDHLINIHIYNAIMKNVKINNSFSDLKNNIDKQLELNNKAIEDYSNILIYYINDSNKNIFIENQTDFDKYFNYNDIKNKDLYIQSKGYTSSYYKRPNKFEKKIELILENETNKILNNISNVLLNKNKEEQVEDGNGNKCSRCQNIIKGKIFKSLINENEYYCNKCSNFHSYPLLIIN